MSDTYTRSYTGEREPINLPSGYDGIALREEKIDEKRDTGATLQQNYENEGGVSDANATATNPWERASAEPAAAAVGAREGGGIFGNIPFLSGLFEGGKIPFLSSVKPPRIGFEEMIIIGAALLMFFSKNGDKECAVILILLLFIS